MGAPATAEGPLRQYPPGSKVLCLASFDNQRHPAEILDRRTVPGGQDLYYVHFLDCDKRLDEYVTVDKLTPQTAACGLEHAPSINNELLTGEQKITRGYKRKFEETHHVTPVPLQVVDELYDPHADKEHHDRPRVKNIQVVEFGKYEMDTWYYAPYPDPYAQQSKLYICEYTLKYFRKKKTLLLHQAKLQQHSPPGELIYRSPPPPSSDPTYSGGAITNPPLAVYEVDGKAAKTYCQNLCLLSKLFLDHKTLYYDVDPFLFYVLCEVGPEGHHLVGYFSKEKLCVEDYNLACILTLPAFQRKGYGRFLITFAYELSRREGRIGTPERPLSDLGQVSFRSYWTRMLLEVLKESKGDFNVKDLSDLTMIHQKDVVDTLQSLGLMKYWKGQYIVDTQPKLVEEQLSKVLGQRCIEVDAAFLHWTPLHSPTAYKKPPRPVY